MFYHFTNAQLISAVVVLIFLVFVAVVGFVHRRGTRTRAFRNRFGEIAGSCESYFAADDGEAAFCPVSSGGRAASDP